MEVSCVKIDKELFYTSTMVAIWKKQDPLLEMELSEQIRAKKKHRTTPICQIAKQEHHKKKPCSTALGTIMSPGYILSKGW